MSGRKRSVLRDWGRACSDLARRDAVLARLIAEHSGDALRGSGDSFTTLLNAVVGQQISVAAADGIWGRLERAFPELSPRTIAAAAPETLRELGLSRRKAEYIIGIAQAFDAGELDPQRWKTMSDDEVRADLTRRRGVGPWTADMVLIFYLHRPDVLPLGDLGLVNAAARLYRNGELDGAPLRARQNWLGEFAERWRPWRTVATWFIWRDLDAEPVVY